MQWSHMGPTRSQQHAAAAAAVVTEVVVVAVQISRVYLPTYLQLTAMDESDGHDGLDVTYMINCVISRVSA